MSNNNTLQGKTMVVTGATSGIGREAALELASRGAFVIGVGRSRQRCDAVLAELQQRSPEAEMEFCVADLSSQMQVRKLADNITSRLLTRGYEHLDVLLNVAGTVSSWFVATEDNYELQFAVNHLAPFTLTHGLLPVLRAAPEARVLSVSSGSHRNTRMHWSDVMLRQSYHTLKAYKQSKLANVLFTYAFNHHFASSNIRAFAVDPGLVNTEIGLKQTGGLARRIWERRRHHGATAEQGARTAIFLASKKTAPQGPVWYYKDCQPVQPSRYACDVVAAERLWQLSERLTGMVAQRHPVHTRLEPSAQLA